MNETSLVFLGAVISMMVLLLVVAFVWAVMTGRRPSRPPWGFGSRRITEEPRSPRPRHSTGSLSRHREGSRSPAWWDGPGGRPSHHPDPEPVDPQPVDPQPQAIVHALPALPALATGSAREPGPAPASRSAEPVPAGTASHREPLPQDIPEEPGTAVALRTTGTLTSTSLSPLPQLEEIPPARSEAPDHQGTPVIFLPEDRPAARVRTGEDPTGPDPGAGPPAPPGTTWSPNVRLSAGTGTAQGRRSSNQDNAWASSSLLAIADGVGGRPGGKEAAATAIRAVKPLADRIRVGRVELREVAHQAHAMVRRFGAERPELRGLSCTLELVGLAWEADDGPGPVVHGVHLGDSAVWFVPCGGRPRRVTSPHNDETGLLLRALGHGRNPEFDTWEQSAGIGDRIVLATDGLWADLDQDAVVSLIHGLKALSPATAAQLLVQAALQAGGSDNITVIVADVAESAC